MEAPVIAAILGGSVSLVLNLFQFLTNRRLTRTLEKEKFEYQLKLEKAKLNYGLLKTQYEARQKYVADIANALYKLRKAIEVVKGNLSVENMDKKRIGEISNDLKDIYDSNRALRKIYADNNHISSLVSEVSMSFSHSIAGHVSEIQNLLTYIYREPKVDSDKIEHLQESVGRLYDNVLGYEQQFKALIVNEYDDLIAQLN